MSDYAFGADLPSPLDTLPALPKQGIKDIVAADHADREAVAWERAQRAAAWSGTRRAPWNWPCKVDERYCIHRVPCKSAMPYKQAGGKRRA